MHEPFVSPRRGNGLFAMWSPGTFHFGLAFPVYLLCQARSWQCLPVLCSPLPASQLIPPPGPCVHPALQQRAVGIACSEFSLFAPIHQCCSWISCSKIQILFRSQSPPLVKASRRLIWSMGHCWPPASALGSALAGPGDAAAPARAVPAGVKQTSVAPPGKQGRKEERGEHQPQHSHSTTASTGSSLSPVSAPHTGTSQGQVMKHLTNLQYLIHYYLETKGSRQLCGFPKEGYGVLKYGTGD